MFMDITDFRDLGKIRSKPAEKIQFPDKVAFQNEVYPLLSNLNKSNIQSHLEHFTSFHNRWYRSEYGEKSFNWLLKTINDTITDAGADKYGVSVKAFEHPWPQSSIIVTIPGKTNSTVITGAHQDSVNHRDPMGGRAPGADDDGSGTMTILEVLRTLLSSKELLEGEAENTVEFHWYSGEEGGMLGSQAVFSEYEKTGRDVKAMLQQDMTGFIELTVEAGKPLAFGLMMDCCARYPSLRHS
jgi:bacterial leucyl aminopeptidase